MFPGAQNSAWRRMIGAGSPVFGGSARRASARRLAACRWWLRVLSGELRDFVALRRGRLRELVARHRLSRPRPSENVGLLIAAAGAAILLGWLVSSADYPGGSGSGAAREPTLTRAITSAPVPPRPAHRRQPKRAATRKATAASATAQRVATNVVPVPSRRRHEISSAAAIGTTTNGGIQSASGDSSQTGRAKSVHTGSSAPGSTDTGSSGSGGGSGSLGGTETRPGDTSATPVNGTGTVSGTRTTTSSSGTSSGTDATTSGTGTASGKG